MLLAACTPEAPEQGGKRTAINLETAMPGTWESVSLRVAINTVDGSDSSFVFEVREEEWERRLGVKPVRTYYQLDHKYRQEFTSLADSLLSTSRGMWNIFGDTLMMVEPNATYYYEVSIENGLAQFFTGLDWDGDGAEDDDYLGVHRKVSSSTE